MERERRERARREKLCARLENFFGESADAALSPLHQH
jgi:hypothetical protein